ncbi:helix-turn-helix domain-containing protein [Polyangium mundeleinium]|uniref:Helix-turn-helix transcriptional regulator n=1 Tax=Polyangium mundeleinium TaxID=2995306 RepID=A0ABT5F2E8_9BACT|nr:helix-turn-helix transcriptional regulator [Polyangium mundeleinium]MDC0747789.1 helix-turn-helix transcriptional regulator [Polyangium mundeleinium]
MTEHDHDQEPPSIPAILSAEQAARVRKALTAYATGKTRREVAKAIGFARMYICAFLRGEVPCSDVLASRIARAVGVDLVALVRGGST